MDVLDQIIKACDINLDEFMDLDESMLELMEEVGITIADETPPVQKTKAQKKPQCHICSRTLRSYTNLLKHLKTVHKAMTIQCEKCDETFNSRKLLAHHKLQKCNQ